MGSTLKEPTKAPQAVESLVLLQTTPRIALSQAGVR